MKRQCSDCKWCEKIERQLYKKTNDGKTMQWVTTSYNICCRYPPTRLEDETVYPHVENDDGCGEYEVAIDDTESG